MKRLLGLIFLLSSIALGQYYPPVQLTAFNPSGNLVNIGADSNGNLYTSSAMSVSVAAALNGYVPPVALTAQGPNGQQVYVKADQYGNLLISGAGSSGGGSAGAITNVVYSPSDTTIVASWYTTGASSSAIMCGTSSGVDNNVAPPSIFHQVIVAGLASATQYSCTVTSGSVTSVATNVTTIAAQTKTAINSISLGSGTATSPSGDTLYNAVSNDNKTYTVIDDSLGLDGCCSANMALDVFTNESTMVGSTVNALTNFGAQGAETGTDGPNGFPLNNKGSGLFAMGGNLYYFAQRDQYVGQGSPAATTQLTWYGNWMMSSNHGVSWNTWQNPNGFLNAGTLPSPLGSYMWATKYYGWCVPTRYAMDDGTLGYLTPGNRIDGADAYVYISCTDGNWNNSSNLYLTRISRVQFAAQNPGAIQYWIGPSSPTSAQFVTDANWSSSSTSAAAIYSAANQTSSQDMIFIPGLNYYLMTEWYQPNSANTAVSNWRFLAAPTPAGPWTQVGSASWGTQGYYNPVVMHRTAATNTLSSQIPLTLLYSGYGSYYHPTYATLTLNPTLLIDGTHAATFGGSVAHQLTTAYSGPLIRIQRASDSTQTDIAQTAGGLLNQTQITTFCSGTTCNVAKLYDQSGNGHDVSQSTFAHMPIIYTSGAITTNGVNGQPAMQWDNTSRYLTASITFAGTLFESVGVATLGVAGSSGYAGLVIMSNGSGSGGSTAGMLAMADENQNGNQVANGSATCALNGPSITFGTQFMFDNYDTLSTSSICDASVNGGSAVGNTGATSTMAATVLSIGADYPVATYYWNGYASDIVIYSTELTTGQRAFAHSAESAFFGTP